MVVPLGRRYILGYDDNHIAATSGLVLALVVMVVMVFVANIIKTKKGPVLMGGQQHQPVQQQRQWQWQ
jgi:hypothetical protein